MSAPPFRSPREQLDEMVALAAAALDRRAARLDGREAKVAELDAVIGEQRGRIAARRAADPRLPMEELRRACALTDREDTVLWLLALAELSPEIRRRVAAAGRGAVDVELIGELVYGDGRDTARLVDELAAEGALFGLRLIEWSQPRRADTGYLERALRVAPRVLELVLGRRVLDPAVAGVAALLPAVDAEALAVERGVRDEAIALIRTARAAAAAGRNAPVIALLGRDGAGRARLAAATGAPALRVDTAALPTSADGRAHLLAILGREARLFDAVLVFDELDRPAAGAHQADVAERLRAIELAIPPTVAIVVTARAELGVGPQRGRGLVSVRVPTLGEDDRRALWRRALGDGADDVAATAAGRYAIPAGTIVDAAATATARAAARGGAVSVEDVHRSVSARLGEELGSLAIPVTWRARWEDLVLPDDVADELRELRARIRHRRTVFETWGFGAGGKGLGLSALFGGPPGTGKSMAAAVIAQELGLELYQIDLARVVSKYVGETEQHLARLFDAAEAGHAVLLFDEADALFARRTDVKSSNDRYANLEVNYLLQRMESFAGITILTTNAETVIDEAFRRRLAFRITFPLPEAEERARLWRSHLPAAAAVAADVDVDALAQRYAMSGGYIKNAVLRAAFLAADEGSAITMGHLVRAAGLEYAAMGKVLSQGR